MGHNFLGVTTDLSIKYRLPVHINQYAEITTSIDGKFLGSTLYTLKSIVVQNREVAISASAKFYSAS
jgi:hypothetical protein